MKMMKKLLMVMCTAVLVLAGCGSSTPGSESGTASASAPSGRRPLNDKGFRMAGYGEGVEVRDAKGNPKEITEEMWLEDGDTVIAAGEGVAKIKFNGSNLINLMPEAEVQVLMGDPLTIVQKAGIVSYKIKADAVDAVEIRTDNGTIRAEEEGFMNIDARNPQMSVVEVTEGSFTVIETEYTLKAGEATMVSRDATGEYQGSVAAQPEIEPFVLDVKYEESRGLGAYHGVRAIDQGDRTVMTIHNQQEFDEFVKLLKNGALNDTYVILEDGVYYTYAPIDIKGCSNLVITGSGNSAIIQKGGEEVIGTTDSKNITIANLTLGHEIPVGSECEGGVAYAKNSEDIAFINCDMFGCGKYGISLENAKNTVVDECTIRDCFMNAMLVYTGSDADISKTLVYGNDYASNPSYKEYDWDCFQGDDTSSLTFRDSEIHDNQNPVYVSEALHTEFINTDDHNNYWNLTD